MSYSIEFINETKPTVDYSEQAVAEYEAGIGDGIDKFTELFERDNAFWVDKCEAKDIGGLIVYLNAGDVRAVYDYENFCGWVV